jgi:L-lactate dehydrogenase complex protein LldF
MRASLTPFRAWTFTAQGQFVGRLHLSATCASQFRRREGWARLNAAASRQEPIEPMLATSPDFKDNAHHALANAGLQKALTRAKGGFLSKRTAAAAGLPEFEELRDIGRDIKNHTLAHLDFYLEEYEAKVQAAGGQVHWCSTPDDARAAVLRICRAAGARTVTKGKSMISEELAINDHLEAHGIEPVETDLGEYILQLRKEPPSHIIGPAFHLNREDWEESFREMHTDLPKDRVFHERRDILSEARTKLRSKFLAADVGITGRQLPDRRDGLQRHRHQ